MLTKWEVIYALCLISYLITLWDPKVEKYLENFAMLFQAGYQISSVVDFS